MSSGSSLSSGGSSGTSKESSSGCGWCSWNVMYDYEQEKWVFFGIFQPCVNPGCETCPRPPDEWADPDVCPTWDPAWGCVMDCTPP